MTIQMYLSTMSQLVFAVTLTVVFCSFAVVIMYYAYKAAEGLIRKREKIVTRIGKSKIFRENTSPTISMVRQGRKVAGGKQ